MIINPYLVLPSVSVDPDAQAFINASGITDSIQQNAINQLVVNLKSFGLWAKMKAIYPFVGHTATTHKWNLKDPRDLNAAFRLVFSGGWNHSNTGAKPNGTNAYAETFYNFSLNSTNSNVSYGLYSRHIGALSGYELGALDGNYCGVTTSIANPDGNTYFCANNFVLNGAGNHVVSDFRGFFVINKVDISTQRMFKNGVQVRQSGTTQNTTSNNNAILGARRVVSIIEQYNSREHAFTYFGETLTNLEISNLYTAVQTYQTSLGRNV